MSESTLDRASDKSGDSLALTDVAPDPVEPVQRSEPWIVLAARRGWIPIDWRELWRYHELLYFLIWRDVKVRYKQTVLGALWAALQPLTSMLVFTIFFGTLARISFEGPYPLYLFAGLLPWTFFANAVGQAGPSLLNSASLVTKVYFPRLMVPTATVAAGLVDLTISFVVMAVMMACYRVTPPLLVCITPALVLLVLMTALGVGYWLSALTLLYRDFRFVVPFMVQLWMFCSPVVYPVSMVPTRWQWVLALNPMTGILDAFRCALLGAPMGQREWQHLGIAAGISLVLLVSGLFCFQRAEARFADVA